MPSRWLVPADVALEVVPGQLCPVRDAELAEDRLQVRGDRARREEELRCDLLVRAPARHVPGDLELLGGQQVEGLGVAPAQRLARGAQLAPGALRPCLRAGLLEELQRAAQLVARL